MSEEERGLASRLEAGRSKYWYKARFDLNVHQAYKLALILSDYMSSVEKDHKNSVINPKELENYQDAQSFIKMLDA